MPVIPFIPAIITAGATIYSSSQAKSAAKDATSAQTASNDQALALQKSQFDTTQAEYAPWRTVGAGALQMLARTMGIKVPTDTFSYYNLPTTGGGTTNVGAGTPASQAGQPDWNAYLTANPDVKAATDQLSQQGVIGPSGQWKTPQDWAAFQYSNTGKSEGRALPTIAADPANANAPANNTLTTAATSGPQAYDANGLPITNTPGKPTGLLPANSSTAPAGSDPRYGDFYASPDYQFRVDQGKAAVTGNYAAKGLIDSGALGKGLIDYGQKSGSQEFGDWYNRIASLAGVGQTAVAGSTSAGQANTNAQSGIIQANGQAQASSLATQGGINAGLIQNLGGTASGLIKNLGATAASSGSGYTSDLGNDSAAISGAVSNVAANSNYSGGLFGSTI